MLLKLIGHEFHNPERSGNCKPLFVICCGPVKLIAESRGIQQNHTAALLCISNEGMFPEQTNDVFNDLGRDTDSLPKNGRESTRPQTNTKHLVNYKTAQVSNAATVSHSHGGEPQGLSPSVTAA